MLNPDYRDMLSAFEDVDVEYLLVGAYALAAHGQPRATGDIDLWVRPSSENAGRVMQALQTFGAPLSEVSPEDFAKPEVVFQIGVTPRRIDILTSIEGVEFAEAWKDRMKVEIEGVVVSAESTLSETSVPWDARRTKQTSNDSKAKMKGNQFYYLLHCRLHQRPV